MAAWKDTHKARVCFSDLLFIRVHYGRVERKTAKGNNLSLPHEGAVQYLGNSEHGYKAGRGCATPFLFFCEGGAMATYSRWEAYQPYWVRKGTRRPLPSLYQAIELYGENSVRFFAPDYVKAGYCKYCGKKIENKRRSSYCSDDCSRSFQDITVWHRGRGAYAMRILYRDNFTCQDCGEIHACKNEYGVYLPIDDGELEIHHILPVSGGGDDSPANLVTLCKSCHLERHKLLRERKTEADNGI